MENVSNTPTFIVRVIDRMLLLHWFSCNRCRNVVKRWLPCRTSMLHSFRYVTYFYPRMECRSLLPLESWRERSICFVSGYECKMKSRNTITFVLLIETIHWTIQGLDQFVTLLLYHCAVTVASLRTSLCSIRCVCLSSKRNEMFPKHMLKELMTTIGVATGGAWGERSTPRLANILLGTPSFAGFWH